MPKVTVVKVQRIQNARLWDKFQQSIQHAELDAQEKMPVLEGLYHGTSRHNPEKIYNNLYGISFKRSREGCMWGPGSYFAVNAS